MKEITLDEMVADVQAKEALMQESKEVQQILATTSMEVINAAESGKVKILTDYDADGICSAYIMEKTIKAINSDCEVEVQCNDRRGSYGLSPNVQGDGESKYIVCDMGSNQLDLARERLGEDVIIVDHHLIEDEKNRAAFASLEPSNNSSCLCNPHSLNKIDSENAQYCATGLAYRIYQESERICKNFGKPFQTNEKQDNTVAVMACIGTATDMVDVMDLNSYNRQILKNGLKIIDNVDESNLDFIIGNMLAKNGIGDNVTAHQLAFNVGAFLNSASRMSEISDRNGAQEMYDAITSDEHLSATYRKLDALQEQNSERKEYVAQLVCEDEYKRFVDEHRFGKKKDDNIAIYQLPDNVPAAFAGLAAGKLTETCDKAIICLTYNTEKGYYTGSGRNPVSNETSLQEFMEAALSREKEFAGDKELGELEITYGGHEEAIGISKLNNIIYLQKLIDESKDLMKAKDSSEKVILKISPADIQTPETLEKIKALEPTGIGLQIPSVKLEGHELRRDKNFLKQRDDWKRITLKAEKTSLSVSDWSYSPTAYPQTGKKGDEIALVAELSLNNYRGQHVELSAKFDRAFFSERTKEVEKEHSTKKDKEERVG